MAKYVKAAEAVIGTVSFEHAPSPAQPAPSPAQPAPAPQATPARPTSPNADAVINSFIERHRTLKSIIDSKGCCSDTELIEAIGIDHEELLLHHALFDTDEYSAKITPQAACNRAAILELRKKIESLGTAPQP